jgi:hypothetical protein
MRYKLAERATAAARVATIKGCRPLRRLVMFRLFLPGADAPGFMLSPAPQAIQHAGGVRTIKWSLLFITST